MLEQYDTYENIIEAISSARRFGNLPGVETSRRMLEKMGHSGWDCPFVHVAGTNGKGSVCAFLSSILIQAGKRVGTFTSPHLMDFRERITVNGKQIPKEDVVRLGKRLLSTDFGVTGTMFDYCLLMAVLYFREQQCDIWVIETGLGGRLDSTNALGTPKAAVITKIGLDHTEILGDSLEKIAKEKAGILKYGCPLVLERQEKEAFMAIQNHFAGIYAEKKEDAPAFWVVSQKEIEEVRHFFLKMKGVHQWENAAAAMLAAKIVLGENVSQELLRRGLEKAVWKGRMEVLSETPFLMVDGAHNGHGVNALAESLRMLYPREKFHFIMGVMEEKDYGAMIETLLPLALDFRTVTPKSSRALVGERLAECIRAKGLSARAFDSVEECLRQLPADAKNIALGSLYFVGEVMRYYPQ